MNEEEFAAFVAEIKPMCLIMEDHEKDDPLDTLIHWRKMEALGQKALGGGMYVPLNRGK